MPPKNIKEPIKPRSESTIPAYQPSCIQNKPIVRNTLSLLPVIKFGRRNALNGIQFYKNTTI